MKSSEIRTILEEICASKEASKSEAFGERYPEFKTNYPVLFSKACDGSLDSDRIDYMLRMLEQVQNKSTTQYDASAVVGQKLFDDYVAPRLKNP